MYDISDEDSFYNIKNYIKQIQANAQTNIVKVLVGNNCEKRDRKVTENQGKNLANEFGIAFFEASPKTNQNVNEVFEYIIGENAKNEEEKRNGFTIDGRLGKKGRKKGCAK